MVHKRYNNFATIYVITTQNLQKLKKALKIKIKEIIKMFYTSKYNSPLGKIILASNGKELTGLWFEGQKYLACNLLNEAIEKQLPIFEQTKKWLDIYFSGKNPNFIPPINIDSTSSFRKKVFQILLTIPYGQTTSYGKIAKQLQTQSNKTVSAQAVGGAVGHNPISLIIPCHRVVGSGGSLTGYAGGIDKKVQLLKLEGALVPQISY